MIRSVALQYVQCFPIHIHVYTYAASVLQLVQWSGRLILQEEANSSVVKGLIAVCRPMQSTPILEIRLDGNMFMSRHDLGMKFTFCDPR